MLVNGRPPDTIDALFAFLVAAVLAWLLVPARRAARPPDRRDGLPQRAQPAPGADAEARAGSRSSPGCSWPASLFLPMVPETRAILVGAAVIALVGCWTTSSTCPPG